MDPIVLMILFALLSGLSSWLQKRKQRQEAEEWEAQQKQKTTQPGRPPPLSPPQTVETPPKKPRFDWQEELRKMLEDAQETMSPRPAAPAPPQPAPPPPPIVVQQPPPPVAGPRAPAPDPRRPVREAPLLAQSSAAHARATRLRETSAAKLQDAVGLVIKHPSPGAESRRRSRSSDAIAAVALLRDRRSVRQAMVLATILSPPKAVEENSFRD